MVYVFVYMYSPPFHATDSSSLRQHFVFFFFLLLVSELLRLRAVPFSRLLLRPFVFFFFSSFQPIVFSSMSGKMPAPNWKQQHNHHQPFFLLLSMSDYDLGEGTGLDLPP